VDPKKNNKYQMYKKSTNSQPKHHLVLSAMGVETTHFSSGGLDFFFNRCWKSIGPAWIKTAYFFQLFLGEPQIV
jgi:hypothetical protein